MMYIIFYVRFSVCFSITGPQIEQYVYIYLLTWVSIKNLYTDGGIRYVLLYLIVFIALSWLQMTQIWF